MVLLSDNRGAAGIEFVVLKGVDSGCDRGIDSAYDSGYDKGIDKYYDRGIDSLNKNKNNKQK